MDETKPQGDRQTVELISHRFMKRTSMVDKEKLLEATLGDLNVLSTIEERMFYPFTHRLMKGKDSSGNPS